MSFICIVKMFEQYHLVLRLDVVLDDVMGGTLLAPVSHNDGRAANDLTGLALGIQLAKTSPLAQLLVGVDLDDGDLRRYSRIINIACCHQN